MSPPLDWGAGSYERIAAQLAPAAIAVVETAAPRPGERTLDIGTGTGTAALAAAQIGARVVGVDPAPRLRALARRRARDAGLEVDFLAGTAEALALDDGSVDVLLSAFGVIFADDPQTAAAEIARVAAPTARGVFSAWLPEGPLAAVMGVRARALAAVAPSPPAPAGPPLQMPPAPTPLSAAPPPPFAWHSGVAVGELFAPYGFSVEVRSRELAFTDRSPEAFIDGELRDHPAWLASAAALEPGGGLPALREQAIEILREANEDPGGFRVRSGYVIVTLSRSAESMSGAPPTARAARPA